jgi:hypothetical protein
MSGQFTPPPRVKNALDHVKLKLKAPNPASPGKFASFVWGLYGGNPRINIYFGTDDGARATAKLDQTVFFVIMQALRFATTQSPEWKMKVENTNFSWANGRKAESPTVESELWIGRDKTNKVWLSVSVPNQPKVKFYITTPEFHTFHNGDGSPMDEGQVSAWFTLGYVTLLEQIMSQLLVSTYVEPEPYKPKGQGGGFGGRSGGGSGYQKQSAAPAHEEDIPF